MTKPLQWSRMLPMNLNWLVQTVIGMYCNQSVM